MEAAQKLATKLDAAGTVQEMVFRMEAFAAAGDWERTTEIAMSLRHAVMLVPERQRRESLQSAQRCLRQVQSLADEAKNDVTERLSALRRGRDATRAYTVAG